MRRTEDYKRELVSILFAQKNLIFWVTFLVFIGAVLIGSYWPPVYKAQGNILVSGKQLSVPNTEALKSPQVRPLEVSKEDLTSEVEILRAPEVIINAVKRLAERYPELGAERDAVPSETLHGVLLSLRTAVVPTSNVINVSYDSGNPALAAELVNTLMEQYIVYRGEFFPAAGSQISPKFLTEQIDQYLEELRKNEDRLIELVETSGVSEPQQEIDSNILLKKRLEEKLDTLKNGAIDIEASLSNLDRALEVDDIQYFSFLNSDIILELSSKLADLLAERGRVARTYRADSQMVVPIDTQIDKTFAAIKAEVRGYRDNMVSDLDAMGQKIDSLKSSIRSYDAENVALQRQIVETERVRRESALLQKSVESLAQRRSEVEINDMVGADEVSNRYVSIMSRAFTPAEAAFPKAGLVIPLGLFVGLLAGVALGFLREYFDHSFKSPGDVQAYTDLPVLFSLAKPHNSTLSMAYAGVILLLIFFVGAFLLWQHVLQRAFS